MTYEALATAIQDRLTAQKMSERKACLRAGLKVDAIRRIRNGFTPSIETLTKLAPILGVRPDYLVSLASAGTQSAGLAVSSIQLESVFVRGFVEAGIWRQAIEWEGEEWYSLTVPRDERFPDVERFGLEVRGSSMDKVYPEGTVVVVVRFSDLGRGPKPGQKVVCLRRSENGSDFEATIKEYQLDEKGRHVLWPRSNDPEFQQPFILNPGPLPVSQGYEPFPKVARAGRLYHDAGSDDVLISALVIQSVRREEF